MTMATISARTLDIRPTRPDDIPAVLGVFASAKRYMRRCGNKDQWAGSYPDEDAVMKDIARGSSFVGTDSDGVIRMTFALVLGPDPTYAVIEGQWLNSDRPYGTLHRVASDGTCRDVLGAAVAFASTRTRWLRIDTHCDNAPMLRAIARCGFTRCGIVTIADGTLRTAFEQQLKKTTNP